MSIYDVFSGGSEPFDKAAWAAQKQSQRKRAYDLIASICTEMLKNGNTFRQYLDVQSRFDRYSVNNAILVAAQMPEATQLKDYNHWKKNGIYINQDAIKITILEPGREYKRDDGSTGVSYNAKEVYDISQTSAKDTAQPQDIPSMRELVSALIDASPTDFQPVDDLELPVYYDSEQQIIFVRTGLRETQLFTSMAKEVAAAIYDRKHDERRESSDFKSYCVAYMVSRRYGVSTEGLRFDQLPAELAEMSTQMFKEELGSMRDVLSEIQIEMFKSLDKAKSVKSRDQVR